jgi:hypothetical protein
MNLRSIRIGGLAGLTILGSLLVGGPGTGGSAAPATFEVVHSVAVDAEIVSASKDGQYLAVVGGSTLTVYRIATPTRLDRVCTVDFEPDGYEPTSVAVHPRREYAVVALKNDPNPGRARAFWLTNCSMIWDVEVGIGPDSVVISPAGLFAAIAIEDEEEELGDPSVCPNVRPGRVDLLSLHLPPQAAPQVRPVPIDLSDVDGVNCPLDPQPEGLAFMSEFALLVTLQENNAIALIDAFGARTIKAKSLGSTTHLADVTQDGVAAVDDSFTGRRESDGITRLSHRYALLADEGDTTAAGGVFSGGRTMTLFDLFTFSVAGDTGSAIEDAAALNAALPNSRTTRRGPEPEGVTAFKLDGRVYAAVTLERSNAVIVFDVTDPQNPVTIAFLPTNTGPEGITYIAGRQLLIVANEAASPQTVSIICVTGAKTCN